MWNSIPQIRFVLAAALLFAGGMSAEAAVIRPTGLTTYTPKGSNNSGGVYTDDVYLNSLTFGGTTFAGPSAFRAVADFEVTSGRKNINVEWGDDDDGRDGDGNPLSKLGIKPILENQESTNAALQDRALLEAFNSFSLTEMTDGESGKFSFKVLFSEGLTDNDLGVDDVPELVFVERGMNDVFDVQLIIGGTFEDPKLSKKLRIDSKNFWNSGIKVDTTEIGSAQTLGFGGFDFNDFGLRDGETVLGFELSVVKGGPDFNGFFLASDDPYRFLDNELAPPAEVPLPAGLPLLLTGIGALVVLRRRPKQ